MSCPHLPDALLGEASPSHLRECAECTAAVREGQSLHELLGRDRLEPPSAEALSKASSPILADLRRPKARPAAWLWQAGAALVAFAIPLLMARHRDDQGWSAALVVLLAAAILAGSAGVARAGALIALAASAAFAFAEGGVPGVAPRLTVDYACTFVELGAAALPLLAAWYVARRSLRPGTLAQAAAAGALAGQAALNLVCGARFEAPHLWTFHVGGVLAAALAGFLLQERLAPRAA
jgi:hypothetical protein